MRKYFCKLFSITYFFLSITLRCVTGSNLQQHYSVLPVYKDVSCIYLTILTNLNKVSLGSRRH